MFKSIIDEASTTELIKSWGIREAGKYNISIVSYLSNEHVWPVTWPAPHCLARWFYPAYPARRSLY